MRKIKSKKFFFELKCKIGPKFNFHLFCCTVDSIKPKTDAIQMQPLLVMYYHVTGPGPHVVVVDVVVEGVVVVGVVVVVVTSCWTSLLLERHEHFFH